MAAKDDVREFLTTRRARITPEQAGLPVHGVTDEEYARATDTTESEQ